MKAYPFLIRKDASGERLQLLEGKGKEYHETWLQELIRKQPDILPIAEIEAVFYPAISIGREVSTEAGAIDNLFISPRGYLTLVETKLWRNPEARREVVAQVIDYANSLSKWNYERLNNVVKEYTKKYEKMELDLVDFVEKQLGHIEGGQDFFEETVVKNLRLGRFLALVVSDKIRESVVEMVNYVYKYPGLALNVALVELQGYRIEEKHKWPLLFVPRVIARTEIVERSIVQVTVTEEKLPEIDIRQEKKVAEERRRVSLTEEAFWELLRQRTAAHGNTIRNLIERYKNKIGIEIISRENSLVVTLDIHGTGRLASLFFVTTTGKLNVWPLTLHRQLSIAGIDINIAKTYSERMRKILHMTKKRVDYSQSIKRVDINEFKRTVDDLIHKIELQEPKE